MSGPDGLQRSVPTRVVPGRYGGIPGCGSDLLQVAPRIPVPPFRRALRLEGGSFSPTPDRPPAGTWPHGPTSRNGGGRRLWWCRGWHRNDGYDPHHYERERNDE